MRPRPTRAHAGVAVAQTENQITQFFHGPRGVAVAIVPCRTSGTRRAGLERTRGNFR